jgi:hypothetical protein
MLTRITGTTLTAEHMAGFEHHTALIRDGDHELGFIQYVGLRHGGVTRYGWRPYLSAWTGARLRTKREAALHLTRC